MISSFSLSTNTSLGTNLLKSYFLSASTKKNFDNSTILNRRACSFPVTYPITFSKLCNVRSQSESTDLNKIDVKITKKIFQKIEMCRQKIQCTTAESHCCSSTGVLFYNVSNLNENESGLEENNSLAKIEKNISSFSLADFVEIHSNDKELEIVKDIELLEKCNDKLCNIKKQSVLNSDTKNTELMLKSNSANHLTILTPNLQKKNVRFADECGHCLETIRVMTEPSDYPPQINAAVIRRYQKAASLAAIAASSSNTFVEDNSDNFDSLKKPRNSWELKFKQPASEYVKFRETLEYQKVALENVMLKNEIGRVVGTIKIFNISFEKQVFVRYTSDDWRSYFDQPASYQSSPSKTYDTFRFEIELPNDTRKELKVEFCVCFISANNKEYWDSNCGKNYILSTTTSNMPLSSSILSSPILSTSFTDSITSLSDSLERIDAYSIDYGNWSKFASWRTLKTDAPYW